MLSKQIEVKSMDKVEIYSDGACKGNPGRGGWGALLVAGGKEIFGGEPNTTNNRMELMAVIQALNALKRPASGGAYRQPVCAEGHQRVDPRLEGARLEDLGKEPVKNADLWQALDAAQQQHQVEWRWVRGHNGHAGNERADQLANRGVDSIG
jgi:ribonuclease HI